jgi:DMSO/TMAO reductase YedYZ molybdopterin-dependent catalytic subunit
VSEDREIHIDRVRELLAEKGEDVWPNGRENTANVLGEKRELSAPMSDDEARRAMSARSRRGFLVGGVATVAAVLGWRWMSDDTKDAMYHKAFRFNERISQFLYSPRRLAPECPPDRVTEARTNGLEGLESELDLDGWRLSIAGLTTGEIALTLNDLKNLTRTEMTTELKCIEGWSIVVRWAGVRFSDLLAAYAPGISPQQLPQYVSLVTPDEQYFVGWDLASIMHPQTLLAYEMNGEPLTSEHGAPLRLASPTKYGIKQIKRIGRIEFTNERPRDFWAQPEYGYDWYAGH